MLSVWELEMHHIAAPPLPLVSSKHFITSEPLLWVLSSHRVLVVSGPVVPCSPAPLAAAQCVAEAVRCCAHLEGGADEPAALQCLPAPAEPQVVPTVLRVHCSSCGPHADTGVWSRTLGLLGRSRLLLWGTTRAMSGHVQWLLEQITAEDSLNLKTF